MGEKVPDFVSGMVQRCDGRWGWGPGWDSLVPWPSCFPMTQQKLPSPVLFAQHKQIRSGK